MPPEDSFVSAFRILHRNLYQYSLDELGSREWYRYRDYGGEETQDEVEEIGNEVPHMPQESRPNTQTISTVRCRRCGRRVPVNEFGEGEFTVLGSNCICFNCLHNRCASCGAPATEDSPLREAPEGTRVRTQTAQDRFCSTCFDNHWATCNDCGRIASRYDFVGNSESSVCHDCFNSNYTTCRACSRLILREDCHPADIVEGYVFCSNCQDQADVWRVKPWKGEAKSFDNIGSTRKFGVEIETHQCRNYRRLNGATEWGCVYECSTDGREFISPVLQGDEGLDEVHSFLSLTDDWGWTVNNRCGLHIHLDLSEETSEECLRIAYAYRKTYSLWKAFVTSNRRTNNMCGSPQYDIRDITRCEHIEDFAEARDRFEFVNWRSYLKQNSFEVRIYQGTLNPREICNWIKLHARFIDRVKKLDYAELHEILKGGRYRAWKALRELIDDENLMDYWLRKASRVGVNLEPVSSLDESETEEGVWIDEALVVRSNLPDRYYLGQREGQILVEERYSEPILARFSWCHPCQSFHQ